MRARTLRVAGGVAVGLSLSLAGAGCAPYGCPDGYVETMGRCLDADGGVDAGMEQDTGVDAGLTPDDGGVDADVPDAQMPSDEDAGTDGGPPDLDSGVDAGPVTMPDSGTDGGIPRPALLRLANLTTGVGPLHICLGALLVTRSASGPTPIPAGDVSDYSDAITIPPIDVWVRAYRPGADFSPSDGCSSGTATPVLAGSMSGAAIRAGESYTIMTVGALGGSGLATPSVRVIRDSGAREGAAIRLVSAMTNIPTNPPLVLCHTPPGGTATEITLPFTFVSGTSRAEPLDLPYGALFDPIRDGTVALFSQAAQCLGAPIAGPFDVPLVLPPSAPPHYASSIETTDLVTVFAGGALGSSTDPPMLRVVRQR